MNNKLEEKFDEAIENAKFNLFEMVGFTKEPALALKAGIAIGYGMAIDDIKNGVLSAEENEI